MGLKDKMFEVSKKIEERRPLFSPLSLCVSNVDAIFNRCLPKETTKNIRKVFLFPQTTRI